MTKYVGQRVKGYVSALDDTGTPMIVAGQRDTGLEITMDGIDVSSKDSEGFWNEVIAGQRSWTPSLSGAHVLGDESHSLIKNALTQVEHTHDTGQINYFEVTEGEGVQYGKVLITSYSKTSPHTDLTTYDIAMEGNGPLFEADNLETAFEAVYGTGTFEAAMARAKAKQEELIKKAKERKLAELKAKKEAEGKKNG